MAQVDFSNALLAPATGAKPLRSRAILGLVRESGFGYDLLSNNEDTTSVISRNLSYTVLENTVSKYVLLLTGEFTASGNQFYIYNHLNIDWKVSNISFSSGDSFSFKITIRIS